jgi:hypothetical protein
MLTKPLVAAPLFFTCADCNHDTCFICHKAHHPPRTCADQEAFVLAHARPVDQASFNLIRNTSVQCPGCKAWVHKYQDCNHMTCTVCKTEFCYRCGMAYGISGEDIGIHAALCVGLGPGHTPYVLPSSTGPIPPSRNHGPVPNQQARPMATYVAPVIQRAQTPVQRTQPHGNYRPRVPRAAEPPRSVGEACQRVWTHIQRADILGHVREEGPVVTRPVQNRPLMRDMYRHMRSANILGNSPDGSVKAAPGEPQKVRRMWKHVLNADILGNVHE